MMKAIERSAADVIVLGGDHNALPGSHPISIIKQHNMDDSREVVLEKKEWQKPKYATMSNPYNGYSKGYPAIFDYLFSRANPSTHVTAKAIDYRVPLLSLSDHQPVWIKLFLGKKTTF